MCVCVREREREREREAQEEEKKSKNEIGEKKERKEGMDRLKEKKEDDLFNDGVSVRSLQACCVGQVAASPALDLGILILHIHREDDKRSFSRRG